MCVAYIYMYVVMSTSNMIIFCRVYSDEVYTIFYCVSNVSGQRIRR